MLRNNINCYKIINIVSVDSTKPKYKSKNSDNSVENKVIKRLKDKAKKNWPNDYSTQEYWINEQIEAYKYMLTIENNSIKRKAQRDWPLDFSTQKYWYNQQVEAKERLK